MECTFYGERRLQMTPNLMEFGELVSDEGRQRIRMALIARFWFVHLCSGGAGNICAEACKFSDDLLVASI